MSLSFDVFWSFRSPYSYLVTKRLVRLVEEWDVTAVIRPVRPLAVRTPDHFVRMDPLWRPYLFLDTKRTADFLGLPFARPRPDPIIQDPVTNVIAAEQPYIQNLTHLGIAACRMGRGLAYIDHVGSLLWDGTVVGWDQGDHLARAAAAAGLDHDRLQAMVDDDRDSCEAELQANEAALRAAGHWGVPTFVFEGEPFFGQDHLDVLLWRLRQHGAAPRSSVEAIDG